MEKSIGEKFPECVKILLKKYGYDRLNSLSMIDEVRISEIETHLQENRDSWNDELNCCNSTHYGRVTIFRFLPGHRATILSIPDKIRQLTGLKRVIAVDRLQEEHKDRSDEEAVQSLVTNIMKYAEKQGFPLNDELININNVQDFERGDGMVNFVYKCRFICPFCDKKFSLKFQKFWQTSNITTHLKKEIDTSRQ